MMKCEIIRDLMPSYIDEITSEESNLEIQKHLETCNKCREYEASMRRHTDSTEYIAINEEKNITEIQPFKKVKKELTLRNIFLIISTVALIGGFLYEIYTSLWFGLDASAEDVQIKYEATVLKNNKIVRLSYVPTTDDIYLIAGYEEFQDDNSEDVLAHTNENDIHMGIIKYKIKPSQKNNIITSSTWEYWFLDEDTLLDDIEMKEIKLSGDEKLIIRFAGDVTKEIRIKDLYTGEGLDNAGIIMN